MSAVALDHVGFSVAARANCGEDCAGDADVCIVFGEDKQADRERCKIAFEPTCGRYGGVRAILREAKTFAYDIAAQGSTVSPRSERSAAMDAMPDHFAGGFFICVFACAGGSGASCAAIGIGRELARYRGESVLYLSLEDSEDPDLFPSGLDSMSVFDTLYRYLRTADTSPSPESFERLFHVAAARDEYGLYRLAPDDGVGSLARLMPHEIALFLMRCATALKLTRIILDFGTRLHPMMAFSECLDTDPVIFVKVIPENEGGSGKRKKSFSGVVSVDMVVPDCGEDIRVRENGTDVGLANAFGLAVKEVCDQITGDMLC